jgi:hypothetical protein
MTDLPSSNSDLRYSGLAVVSFILGALSPLWLVFGLAWGILGFLAVFAGRRAKKEIDLASTQLEGRSLANGGIVIGAIGFTTALFLLIVVVTSPPV